MGPLSDVRQRLTEKQAERAQQAAWGIGRLPNTSASNMSTLASDIFDEDAFEEQIIAEDITSPFEDDYESYDDEIDCWEEENLGAYQDQPYLYRVSFVLKTLLGNGPTKRVKWQGKVGVDDWVKDTFDVNRFDLELGQAMEKCNFQDNLDEVIVCIKSDNCRATRKFVSLPDISQDQWDTKVEPVLKQEYVRFPGYRLEVNIECIGRVIDTLKRSSSSIESPIPSPARRRTRTVQQEEW